MSLDVGVVGQPWPPEPRTWSSSDALLYALGVGAGSDERFDELAFVTENSAGRPQQVLPSFVVTLASLGLDPRLGGFELSQVLHAGMEIELRAALPPEGSVEADTVAEAILDKGRDAIVVLRTTLRDPHTGAPVAVTRSTSLVLGEGGFGGGRGPAPAEWRLPARDPDASLRMETRVEQALLYRLSGDRNPLHSDPVAAARAGFPRPVLHGLCTFGVAARALLHAYAGGDPGRFGRMGVRFTAPVYPGQDLLVNVWKTGGGVQFQARAGDRVVLDRGVFALRAS
ncbi:MaoC/PaaZ C-terminal domain-containing protein [Phytohabitans sp. ZYX-F-186]|uniref:MaoC/PaaZ C-terminal domain-containing protein n=1 Tax=Phytohabitans maris TaxID=3071409 RepID=A0ABU0ZKI5_9ACTN|nr:MaoC/PaaZ C-terminal domain-containing protein [Phytohabitans sp. ZYX-F-186]MDQ7907493.1 MaoC/PaaZ C-terminal domain-containing protein [Phytohabitans sp. ZYX-F-186]